MIKGLLSDLFDGRNRSIDAVADALEVTVPVAFAILDANGYVPDHVGKTSGKLYFRPA